MKKFFALLMAAVLVLSLSATAFAAAAVPELPVNGLAADQPHTFEFTKIYVDQNNEDVDTGKQPVEELSFTVSGNDVANAPQLSVANTKTAANPQAVTVTVTPAENITLGKYNYTITENAGSTAGVTYSQAPIGVQVMIAVVDGNFVETVTFTDGEKGQKLTAITNTYKTNEPNKPDPDPDPNYLYPLTVDKVVEGNMGDKTAEFKIAVTLSSAKEVKAPIMVGSDSVAASKWTKSGDEWTYTANLVLTDGTTAITLYDIPEGVTYTVKEADEHTTIETGHDYSNEPTKGYTATYNKEAGNIKGGEVNDVVVTNTKGAEVDTGINLDSLPYVIILAVAVLGAVAFTVKRRVED